MRHRVLGLVLFHLALTASVLLGTAHHSAPATALAELIGFVIVFALVGLVPLHLELRRDAYTLVLVEAVLVVAVFSMTPSGVVVAAAAGEALSCLASRQRALKAAFNVAGASGAVALAAWVFDFAGTVNPSQPRAWLAALAAIATYGAVNAGSVASVLAVVEGRRFTELVRAFALPGLVSTAASGSLGLTTVVLFQTSPSAPVLLVPLLGTVYLGTRRLALQAAERLRFERLYQASARTSRLTDLEDTLATLAAEARGLATGSAALCCAQRPDDTWVGVLVDDRERRPASSDELDALLGLGGETRVMDLARLPAPVRAALPQGAGLLWVPASQGGQARVALAVVREMAEDDQAGARLQVLLAFAGHAALAVANALLFEEVEESLRHQLDLNRQKEEFVAAVSHELRTPLTSIIGSVSTISRLRHRLEEEAIERLLSTAHRQGQRLNRLIGELLLVAASEHGSVAVVTRPVHVERLVEAVVSELGGPAQERARVCVGPDVGTAWTDEHKLHQIVSNLVENAAKYAPDGLIEIEAERGDGCIHLSVTDSGPGIPEACRDRVFERFVQLDQSATRRQGGTGLGLYLCRQLAELLDGELTLQEAPTGGCRFTLRLVDHGAEGGLPAHHDRPEVVMHVATKGHDGVVPSGHPRDGAQRAPGARPMSSGEASPEQRQTRRKAETQSHGAHPSPEEGQPGRLEAMPCTS